LVPTVLAEVRTGMKFFLAWADLEPIRAEKVLKQRQRVWKLYRYKKTNRHFAMGAMAQMVLPLRATPQAVPILICYDHGRHCWKCMIKPNSFRTFTTVLQLTGEKVSAMLCECMSLYRHHECVAILRLGERSVQGRHSFELNY